MSGYQVISGQEYCFLQDSVKNNYTEYLPEWWYSGLDGGEWWWGCRGKGESGRRGNRGRGGEHSGLSCSDARAGGPETAQNGSILNAYKYTH